MGEAVNLQYSDISEFFLQPSLNYRIAWTGLWFPIAGETVLLGSQVYDLADLRIDNPRMEVTGLRFGNDCTAVGLKHLYLWR